MCEYCYQSKDNEISGKPIFQYEWKETAGYEPPKYRNDFLEMFILKSKNDKKAGLMIDSGYGYRYIDINYCPICRTKIRRLKSMDDEELDIPIKNHSMQLELGICMECGKRKAKYLCDYITGKSFDLYGKGKIETSTCDKYLCEECTNKLNGKDYCKEHIKELKEELKYIKLGDD